MWSLFEYTIGATKDHAGFQKDDAGLSWREFLIRGPGLWPGQRYLNGPGKGAV